MDRISAILLAAGEYTVLEKAVAVFQEGGIFDIRVVVGHNAEKLLPFLKDKNLQLILNKQYSEGMYSSIKAGVESLEDSINGFFLLPADVPLVKPSTVRDMAKAFSISRAGIVYPCYQGKRGHPVFVASNYRETILQWSGSGGLKQLLDPFEKEIMEVHVDDPGILMDMDTPEDYRKLLLLNQEEFRYGRYGSTERPLQHC